MSTIPSLFRWHLEHQTPPAWPTEVVSHDECERHTRMLRRTACGCMRYGTQRDRPYGKIWAASGKCTETNIARLFLTMSADQPLRGSDYACHHCDDPLCAHPEHVYVGTHQTNISDQFYPGRRIPLRREARFYDDLLMEIAAAPIILKAPAPRVPDRPDLSKVIQVGAMMTGSSSPSTRPALPPFPRL